jgi:hypothetical protein
MSRYSLLTQIVVALALAGAITVAMLAITGYLQ